ncbi:WhiB family redox-sensing transcriptional regulator [Halopolyspora algeriensis]|uniref:Transcriptional regulator WhiB n=1 Tax=Halopolyspora algeriensis TaxID=1500506 RepID=A0A368W0U5_9ACTN|nr:WhiB family transcriptional regulator [Halopolyspora algeriensis]RCW46211.1 WhiB family redox-sensing transcriptional regulator [Halopolyspora algeriensis]TQM55614.1 WhiB family redox-sensing transcriptional regulator [Halopolyspora algeriensis]
MTATTRLPVPHVDNYDWQRDAACRKLGSEIFFHPENERGGARHARESQAKQVCARCPVQQACLNHALSVGEPYGVWGGLGEDERRKLLESGNVAELSMSA